MKYRIALSALVAGVLAFGTVKAAPVTDVVFGNLGADGSSGLSSTNTDIGPASAVTLALAQGFTTGTGSTRLQLQSVTLGAFVDGTANRTVSIYSNVSNAPGTALFTSSPTSVSAQNKYTFNFSGANLTAGTNYWVVPDFSVDWSWYTEATDSTQPEEQNASGYSYLGTKKMQAASPGTWSNTLLPYSLSVNAVVPVPEPSTYALAAVGLAVAGFVRARRRKASV